MKSRFQKLAYGLGCTLIVGASLSSFLAAARSENGVTLVQPPLSSQACRDFTDFATQRAVDPRYISADHDTLAPFQTDGIVVMKDGKIVYEWYDGLINQDTPHILWSASKDVTAALVARTIQDGYEYNGKKVTLATRLKEFFPEPPLLLIHPEMAQAYDRITLENLIDMTANFVWKEYYDEDLEHSNFMPMLYLNGRQDMANFALATPLGIEGPGGRWNYSGGNANILMAVLQKIFGADYHNMPNRLLFDPLGMKNARIERDGSDRFIGSSYIYMRLRDIAKLGQLYLQKGVWEGRQLLPPVWTDEAGQISPGFLKTATPLDEIKKLGVQGRRVFWLNANVYREDGTLVEPGTGQKILYPREMPEAPHDMYFAAGHYGQLNIVIPSQNVVIARTGYDLKYWDHIQPLVVKALSCVEPSYKPNPVADLTPPSAGPKQSWFKELFGDIFSLPGKLQMVEYLKSSGLRNAILAKEMCSFLFTMKTYDSIPQGKALSTYLGRSGLPSILTAMLRTDAEISIDGVRRSVTVTSHFDSNKNIDSEARLVKYKFVASESPDPTAGCDLTDLSTSR